MAAATGMAMEKCCAPVGPTGSFIANHPFFVAIRHRSSGVLLAQGLVNDPSSGARAAGDSIMTPSSVQSGKAGRGEQTSISTEEPEPALVAGGAGRVKTSSGAGKEESGSCCTWLCC